MSSKLSISSFLGMSDGGRLVVNTHEYLELNTMINCIMLMAGRVFVLLLSLKALTLLLEDTEQKGKKKSSLNFKTRSASAGRHECPRHSLQVEPYSSLVLALEVA